MIGLFFLLHEKKYNFNEINKEYYSSVLDFSQELAHSMNIDKKKITINYTFNLKLEKFIKKRLKVWHPDFASVVILNKNGEILSLVGYDRKKGFNRFLPFTNLHPAASLFKIITASTLLEKGVKSDERIAFKGKGTTLYKYQLKDITSKRWVRHTTFADAFAKSNNVVMGKLAIKHLSISEISNMSHRFYFNKYLFNNYKLSKSNYIAPVDNYSLAEISSGFNRTTVISTIHAALFSQIFLNNGILSEPFFVKNFSIDNKIYKKISANKHVLSTGVALDLKKMMEKTLFRGTARKHFYRLWIKYKERYRMGGKTGSIKGGTPFGKNDWFTFFIQNLRNHNGLAISVLLINKEKWYVKSAQLTKEIVQYILKNKII